MFSNISFNDYRCQLESRIPTAPQWAKCENMAYCEGFSALVSTKKAGKIEAMISSLILSIIG